jgi:uncharacterized membrane protein YdbT with pleckstrin-like domain
MVFYPYLAFMMLLWPVSLAYGFSRHKNTGFQLTDHQLNLRYRSFRKSIMMIPRHHLQAIAFEANIIQRWQGLSHLRVYILSSPQPTMVQLKDGDISDLMKVYDALNEIQGIEK